MKPRSTFHLLVFLMVVLTFRISVISLAQEASVQVEAIAAAERDAEVDSDTTFWFFVGCMGSVFGLMYAHYANPTVPTSRLLGKSAEYTAIYSDAYKLKVKQIQTSQATRGCIAQGIVSLAAPACYMILIGGSCLLGS